MLERVLAKAALHRIHDPGHIAHEVNDPCLRKNLHEGGKIGGPGAVGVKDHRCLVLGVIAVEQSAQPTRALRLRHTG